MVAALVHPIPPSHAWGTEPLVFQTPHLPPAKRLTCALSASRMPLLSCAVSLRPEPGDTGAMDRLRPRDMLLLGLECVRLRFSPPSSAMLTSASLTSLRSLLRVLPRDCDLRRAPRKRGELGLTWRAFPVKVLKIQGGAPTTSLVY